MADLIARLKEVVKTLNELKLGEATLEAGSLNFFTFPNIADGLNTEFKTKFSVANVGQSVEVYFREKDKSVGERANYELKIDFSDSVPKSQHNEVYANIYQRLPNVLKGYNFKKCA